MADVEDLTHLKHLTEDTMLECLSERFFRNRIYTLTGPVLLALNPFTPVPNLYSFEAVRAFQRGSRSPHLFGIAQAAYSGMAEAALDFKGARVANQSILISGESGAGKTESTKLVMKYLSLCGHMEGEVSQSRIEHQILESNPLLEAFGNARTLRNDNSSRFGKFIQLHFAADPSCHSLKLSGARLETYLLEKVRVCSHAPGERNFHIFHQCCAAAAMSGGVYDFPKRITSNERFRLRLNGFADQTNFSYLNASPSVSIDDILEFEHTVEALRVVGMSVRHIEELLSVLAAILHLGNIEFETTDFGSKIAENCRSKSSFFMACALLSIDTPDLLQAALCTRGISVPSSAEEYRSPLSAAKAGDVRDALSKFIYGSIFSSLVKMVNDSIHVSASNGFIGLLDIFGFEYFETNTFEQLCINYANERLQHLFVNCVLRAEQAMYESESIPWNRLDFPDNAAVISLLQHPQTGILPLLDDECRIVGGNDANFLAKLHKTHASSPLYAASKSRQDWFTVAHFAGPVTYKATSGFVDKNRDTLSADVVGLAAASPLLQRLLASPQTARNRQYTVSAEFRDQLNRMMETVSLTTPFFIRCVKPNSAARPGTFEPQIVLDQLRYGGVVQAVQISRAGFPVRIAVADFVKEFEMKADKTVEAIVVRLGGSAGRYAIGRSKIFLKQDLWDRMHAAQQARRAAAVVTIQAFARMVLARAAYLHVKRALVSVQAMIRSAMVVRAAARERAAAKIQAALVGRAVRQYFLHVRACVVVIQRGVRRKLLKRPRKRSAGMNEHLSRQMEQLGAELRVAKETMKTVDSVRLAYFNSGTEQKSYFAPHIPPAPFFPSRRGGVSARFENAAPVVRTTSIGSIEKRVMKVHDDMARMKALIDRIQNNMNDL